MSESYVLITPARNEEEFLEETIKSVIAQTVKPSKWVIVSDGSVDGTDDIVRKYLPDHDWIEFLRMPLRLNRSFTGKVHSFRRAYLLVENLEWEYIGNLDADVTIPKDYFEFLMGKFEEDPQLGLIGTKYKEGDFDSEKDSFAGAEHVSGACQFFRRACFKSIGGYTPVEEGGEDWIAVTKARMLGWKTRSHSERVLYHQRKNGTADKEYLEARFVQGCQDHYLGNHLCWEFFRACYQMTKPPYFLGGFYLFMGYLSRMMEKADRIQDSELIEFQRKERILKLKKILRRAI